MTKDELREKLEDSDFDVVYEIWDRHCQQEPPDKDDMIDNIMDFIGDSDLNLEDVSEDLENEN